MSDKKNNLGRRKFLGGALGAAAGASAAAILPSATAQAQPPGGPGGPPPGMGGPPPGPGPKLFRAELDVRDCEVTGTIPSDLSGAFYRSGPDAQYPIAPGNIPFDGEGHVSMFRIKNGRADYRSRFAQSERYVAQDKAGKALFPMYRNPSMDDPSVKGLSRSTGNTHVINHKDMILALKEDSPPIALDLLTLETVDPVYDFDGQLPKVSDTFTAHPKVDSITGNIVAFGYEAEGFGSDVVSAFEITPQGKMVWNAKVKVPYVGLLHDFAVTENYIIIYVIPFGIDHEQMAKGGIHWSWDGTKKTYFGAFRRDGDGSDVRWFEGANRSCTHVMGAFEDGGRIYFDGEMSEGSPFPFMPNKDGSSWDPVIGQSHITRFSVDVSSKSVKGYEMEVMYPHVGALPRQDDRYNTQSYRYGFMGCPDPFADNPRAAGSCYARFDNATRTSTLYNAGPGVSLAELCFAPKSKDSGEGVGYIIGVATQRDQSRSDLIILDAEHLEDGPVATIHLPVRAAGQIHGWWVREDQMPQA